jgi:hypothetical protein
MGNEPAFFDDLFVRMNIGKRPHGLVFQNKHSRRRLACKDAIGVNRALFGVEL